MLLIIDIGNSATKLGIYQKDELIHSFKMSTKRSVTSDEVWLYMAQFFEHNHIPIDRIRGAAISSVVPPMNHAVTNAIRKRLNLEPFIVGENLLCRMSCCYENPRELGADRLVDAWAAYKLTGGPAVVVDFGTATTCDAVSAEGDFVSGMIFPGLQVSVNALYERTSKLTKIEILKAPTPHIKNTVESMQLGAYYGYLGAVERMIATMKEIVGQDAAVVATGGFSHLFEDEQIFDRIVPHLQLDGIRMLYKQHNP